LPGIGNIGRIAAGYLVHELKAKKFAELYSPKFFPFVMVHNDTVHTLRNEFYYYKNPKGRDLIFLIGDCQTYDPKGHYEVSGKILDFLKTVGCKEIITIGGFGTGKVNQKPKVYAVATETGMTKPLEKMGVDLKVAGKIGTIVGAAGLIVGLGKVRGMKGTVLLAETSGFPIITDPNAAEAVLVILQKMVNIKVNLKKLEEKVKAMHDFIKKLEDIQTQAVEHLGQKGPKKKGEELRYIG